MTAQIANGGHKIYPHIVIDNNKEQPSDKYSPCIKIQKI